MDQSLACVLLLLSLAFGKYVYIEQKKTWHEAQKYCQMFYTDLAPVSNKHDIYQLERLVDESEDYFWIGMERDSTDILKWMWSGGGEVSTFFWALGEPDNRQHEDYVMIHYNRMYDAEADFEEPFFCYRVVVVRERKMWKEALDYCRKYHRDLASVGSETEMLLIQKELGKNVTTERIWIGLHFFSGHWLWVDRQPLDYEAWGQGNKPACPKANLRCAALHVMGGKQSSSTDSPLVTNATEGTGAVHTHNTGSVMKTTANTELNIPGVSQATAGVNQSVWEVHDCEERLHFICY